MSRSEFLRVRWAGGNYPRVCVQALLSLALASCGDVHLQATTAATPDDAGVGGFSETFDTLDPAIWSCEGSCPALADSKATFSLQPDEPPEIP